MAGFAGVRPVAAEGLRVATYNVSLGRKGPGVLLKAILSGKDKQVRAVVATIAAARPDILLLNDFDHDFGLLALDAFRAELLRAGVDYPFRFAPAGNAGRPLKGGVAGFGAFPGNGEMALLSRFPVTDARTFNRLPWQDGLLASRGLWDVTLDTPLGPLHVLATHATVPAFGKPAGRNIARNAAELDFWRRYLDGVAVTDDQGRNAALSGVFVLLGDFNNAPDGGRGLKPPLLAVLEHPAVQDPAPLRDLPSVNWPDVGVLRVDYVLPARGLTVVGAGVETNAEASHHALVWVGIAP